ncbi:hypothetical protein Ae201684_012878 [Aphanomyces euteiches]|uniref:Uncharacterized protein n=1 Tax=Aphanomyces euteiches TaxID=100861 RepID=A0A6G0WQE4_9STRA|nr:hypothetical protein Ae201684_012878 [Aphanomyces euteiches]
MGDRGCHFDFKQREVAPNCQNLRRNSNRTIVAVARRVGRRNKRFPLDMTLRFFAQDSSSRRHGKKIANV